MNNTLRSIFWSHISLIVQPAPLITKAPEIIKLKMPRSGRVPGAAANATLQLQGQKSNHVPIHCIKERCYFFTMLLFKKDIDLSWLLNKKY